MATAVVLLDIHNEYNQLQSVRGMLDRIASVVQTARESGSLVYYLDSGPTKISSNIMDGVRPRDSDPVLSGEMGLDKLRKLIKKHDVQGIIFVGALTTEKVIDITFDTAPMKFSVRESGMAPEKEIKQKEVRIIICLDGTIGASKSDHENRILPGLSCFLGADIVICSEVQEIIRGMDEVEGIVPPSIDDINNQRIDVFEFQSVLRGAGVYLPSDAIVSLFSGAKSNTASKTGDDEDGTLKFTVEEIGNYLAGQCNSEGIATRALKATCLDVTCVLYSCAGTFLLLPILFGDLGSFYNTYIGGLAVTLGYLIPSAMGCLSAPINKWRETTDTEHKVIVFKERIRKKAAEYESIKVWNRTSILTGRETRLSENFYQLMQYIEEVIFCGEPGRLSKSDVEMLLLSELGTGYTSHILKRVLKLASQSTLKEINTFELHQFLVSTDEERSHIQVKTQRIWHVFTQMRRNLGYILSLFFFVAAVTNLLRWSFVKCNCVEIPAKNYLSSWLYNVGTLGFSHMGYIIVKHTLDTKDRARELLSTCINYARYYNADMDVWKQYRESHSLDKAALAEIFEQSDILLSESQLTTMIKEIDFNSDGTLSAHEIDAYLQSRKGKRELAILSNCLQDFNFLSNSTWFIGAIGYCVALYYGGEIATIGNIVGAVGYFLGGLAYTKMFYVNHKIHLNSMIDLLQATRRILVLQQGDDSMDHKSLLHSVIRRTVLTQVMAQDGKSEPKTMLRNTAFGKTFRHKMNGDEESHMSIGYDLMGPALRTTLMQDDTTNLPSSRKKNVGFVDGADPIAPELRKKVTWNNKKTLLEAMRNSWQGQKMVMRESIVKEGEEDANQAGEVVVGSITQFLSRLISSASGSDTDLLNNFGSIVFLEKLEWTSSPPIAGDLLVYRVSLNEGIKESTGFLYVYPSCYDVKSMEQIMATLSPDGTKIIISNFPSLSTDENLTKFTQMMPSVELEAILPFEFAPSGSIIGTSVAISGEDAGNQSAIHFLLENSKKSVIV